MNKKVYSGIGGQAVLEGIMMRNKNIYSIACRLEDGSIKVEAFPFKSFDENNILFKIPIIRGIISFVTSMIIGYKTLMKSSEFVTNGIEEEPSKLEKWIENHFGKKFFDFLQVLITIISIVLAISIFMIIPAGLSNVLLYCNINNKIIISSFEGIIRIVIFIIYIKIIGKIPEIKRTFEYHGAEHKCINCIENGLDLNVGNVLISSKEHKRCGTSFVVIVMIISIFFFMFIPTNDLKTKFISRLLFIPLIAGVSYEVLKLAGKFDNKFVDIISKPGMWMQGLTTKEPNANEVEVAIVAVEKVFDWKKFKEENFNDIQ